MSVSGTDATLKSLIRLIHLQRNKKRTGIYCFIGEHNRFVPIIQKTLVCILRTSVRIVAKLAGWKPLEGTRAMHVAIMTVREA